MNGELRRTWILWFALASHLAWAIILVFDSSALNVTSIHAIASLLGSRLAALITYLLAVGTASWAMFQPRRTMLGLVALLPQQALLVLSAQEAVRAIANSAFADGVVRPRGFIAADQGVWIILAVLHTACLVSHFWRPGRRQA